MSISRCRNGKYLSSISAFSQESWSLAMENYTIIIIP